MFFDTEERTPHQTTDPVNAKDEFINILLLGETGVGKSTFINSIVNYLTYSDFEEAENKIPITLIPSKYTVKDKYGRNHTICIGFNDDKNECLDTGMSATQDVKSYVFSIKNEKRKVRLIDTPGMGDVRGIAYDNKNWLNILKYIEQYQHMHAICYLLKPTQSRRTVYFDYCITEILSRLDKLTSKNLIFVFTNTRGVHYTPGDTFSVLQKVLGDIKSKPPYVDVPLNKNVFCCDNEAFRYLAVITKNVEFDNLVIQRNRESWDWSVKQCRDLINFIVGKYTNLPLEPCYVKNIIIINEIRSLVLLLSKVLAEISQTLANNMILLKKHKKDLDLETDLLKELQQYFNIPIVDLKIKKSPYPMLVCASKKCTAVYKVGNINKRHYKQICQCVTSSKISMETIGSPEIAKCIVIDPLTKACKKCGCDFSTHMVTNYKTIPVDGKTTDTENPVKNYIVDKEKLLENIKRLIEDASKQNDELKEEQKIIATVCTNFAHFLQNNVVTSFSETYTEYVEYLIINERARGISSSQSTIHDLENLLEQYKALQGYFNEALSRQKNVHPIDTLVTPQMTENTLIKLYQLKHNGMRIKKLYEDQKKLCAKTDFPREHVYHMLPHLETVRSNSEPKGTNESTNKTNGQQKRFYHRKFGQGTVRDKSQPRNTGIKNHQMQTNSKVTEQKQTQNNNENESCLQNTKSNESLSHAVQTQNKTIRSRPRNRRRNQSQSDTEADKSFWEDRQSDWAERQSKESQRREKSYEGKGRGRSVTRESNISENQQKEHSEIKDDKPQPQNKGKQNRGRGRGGKSRQFNVKNAYQHHHYNYFDFQRQLHDAYMAGYLAGLNSRNGIAPPPEPYHQYHDSKIGDEKGRPQGHYQAHYGPPPSYHEGFQQYNRNHYRKMYVNSPNLKQNDDVNQWGNSSNQGQGTISKVKSLLSLNVDLTDSDSDSSSNDENLITFQ